jgi:hypothetical protein
MRIASGEFISRGLNAALRATDGQERSAALPSGEGVAALLGVLAGSSGSTLRHYWRWAPFRAGQRQALAANLRTNVFATQSFAHHVFPASGRTLATGPFVDALAKCRALAKLFDRKLRIFLVLQTRQKGQLHHRGTLCLQGTKRQVRDRPHLIVIA